MQILNDFAEVEEEGGGEEEEESKWSKIVYFYVKGKGNATPYFYHS